MTAKEEMSAKNDILLTAIRDATMPAADRSNMLIFNVCDKGLDFHQTVEHTLAVILIARPENMIMGA